MIERIKEIERQALDEIESSKGNADLLELARIKYLGRKGIITELFKKIADVPSGERPEAGRLINVLKETVAQRLNEAIQSVTRAYDYKGEKVDITLPGISRSLGKVHPITKTVAEICEIFISLGFRVVEGPEIETEHYNFETLNIPLEHPSRDAFDTFYLKLSDPTREPANPRTRKLLLRSHTSPVQTRFMEKNEPPFSIVVPGKVYRPDATDASHSFMFHQIEGLAVSDSIRFSDLKGVLDLFAKQMFGPKTKMRFRPSFFPFTEPSAEVDISCIICKDHRPQTTDRRPKAEDQKRCSVCGGKGWLEILGAGMVNPKVFEKVGYNPEKVTGFAFGMGVERIAMLKYGINDIRMFFENDVRFLRQF